MIAASFIDQFYQSVIIKDYQVRLVTMLALLWQIGDELFSFSSAKLVVMQDN